MKKSYLTLAAMAMIMASCSNEVLIDNEDGQTDVAIGFSTFSDKATKGDVDESTNLEFYHNTMSIYGTKVSKVDSEVSYVFGGDASDNAGAMTGTTATYQATPDQLLEDWKYAPARYWDKQADYDFIAFAPATAPLQLKYAAAKNLTTAAANDIETSAAYSLTGQNLQNAAPQTSEILKGFTGGTGEDIDLMVAEPVKEDGAGHHSYVTFTFKHILAKLNVTFAKSSKLTNATVTVSSVKIEGLKNKGTYSNNAYDGATYASGWKNVVVDGTYAPEYNGAETEISTTAKYFVESLMMPQVIADNQATVTVVYYIQTGDHKEKFTYQLDLQDAFTSFFDRYSYNLKFTIDPDVILFDAGVATWADIAGVTKELDID